MRSNGKLAQHSYGCSGSSLSLSLPLSLSFGGRGDDVGSKTLLT